MRNGRTAPVALGLCLVLLAACRGAPEGTNPEPSRVHIPAGVRELEVAAVPVSGDRIGVRAIEKLRIDTGVRAAEFASPVSVAVAPGGRMYALDILGHRLLAFDADGRSAASWSQAHPVLTEPLAIAALSDGVAAIEWSPNRLVLLDQQGALQREFPMTGNIWRIEALADGTFLTFDVATYTFSHLARNGVEMRRFAALPGGRPPKNRDVDPDLLPEPSFAVADGSIYVTLAATYEIAAFDADGEARFVLRAPWIREPIPEGLLPAGAARERRAGRAMRANVKTADSRPLPEEYPALSQIAVDGRGRLYVFPWVPAATGRAEYPVDVYDTDGQLLVNGTLPFQGWTDALGDDVYRVETGAVSTEIVRYRLTLPDPVPAADRPGGR